jgi:hypothetical protein
LHSRHFHKSHQQLNQWHKNQELMTGFPGRSPDSVAFSRIWKTYPNGKPPRLRLEATDGAHDLKFFLFARSRAPRESFF